MWGDRRRRLSSDSRENSLSRRGARRLADDPSGFVADRPAKAAAEQKVRGEAEAAKAAATARSLTTGQGGAEDGVERVYSQTALVAVPTANVWNKTEIMLASLAACRDDFELLVRLRLSALLHTLFLCTRPRACSPLPPVASRVLPNRESSALVQSLAPVAQYIAAVVCLRSSDKTYEHQGPQRKLQAIIVPTGGGRAEHGRHAGAAAGARHQRHPAAQGQGCHLQLEHGALS